MKKPWKTPTVVSREACCFDGCGNFAEYSRGRPINGLCAAHRKQKSRGQSLHSLHPTQGRRLSLRKLVRELALRYAAASTDEEERKAGAALDALLTSARATTPRRRRA